MNDFQQVANAHSLSQRADGAIPYTATNVNPYFANIAATGAARTGSDLASVRQWIAWYVLRSRDPNPWGIAGAITDYTILANGALQSTGTADSVDAYAATFLTLVATAWQCGDAATRAYVLGVQTDVERIAAAIDAVTDVDGLSDARGTFAVAMDAGGALTLPNLSTWADAMTPTRAPGPDCAFLWQWRSDVAEDAQRDAALQIELVAAQLIVQP